MLYIMIIFSIIGGIDKLLNNKFGLGVKFEEGFKAMGGLALSIIGIYSLSPLIAKGLIPILNPLANLINTDSSVFISSILATDLGAYTTSMEITSDPVVGNFNGLVLGSMLGSTISFTIPVATSMILLKDYTYFSKGVLAGIVTIPVGMIVSGILMKIPYNDIVFSLIPVILVIIPIVIGLIKAQDKMVKIFSKLGKVVNIIGLVGLILSILEFSLGIKLIEGMIPFEEGIIIVANISIVLSGAYPLLYFISRKLHRILRIITNKYDIDEYSILGVVSSLASCIPMFGVYNEMNWKGKIINAAFAVSGAFTFGGQLGYVSAVSPESVNPFVIGKLAAGLSSLCVAFILIKFEKHEEVLVNEY
ncbi:ethanolamine utilization protein EutH [Tissierella sp. Yu-01]|uniref:ethanolamine utilization protein EutH n=1 Tax=Tissierella sp. Yu-01 TaxID=3035694 RepID=UPI00240D44D7|nr:ethanolamine utilization protein EutH [Tissierella sp. Yu-01]WFA09157.1 ethanolamine utilization protein EutH [Tissierella sp. Yu-01]